MSISPVSFGGASPLGMVAAVGETPDPKLQKAQANAQADLLQAVRGVDLPVKMVLARLSDGKGVDMYM